MNVRSPTTTTADGIEIAYRHYQNNHPQALIIAPGFYNSKDAVLFRQMAQGLTGAYDVIVMDFRGHGQSKGRFQWTAKEFLDLEAILDLARKSYEKVGVIGFSLGAANALIAASRSEKIDSLIAVSPPSEFGKIDVRFWRMGIMENIVYNFFQEGRFGKGVRPGPLWRKKIKPIDVVDQIRCPILFVHGEKDWLIGPWHSRKLNDKASVKKRLVVIPGGTHGEYLFRNDPQGILALFKDWFADTLRVV